MSIIVDDWGAYVSTSPGFQLPFFLFFPLVVVANTERKRDQKKADIVSMVLPYCSRNDQAVYSNMNFRKFEITLISASDLPDLGGEKSKMEVYAVVSIEGKTKKRTQVDKHNKRNPSWNHSMKYTIRDSALQQKGVMLVIRLYCKHVLHKDEYIGEVYKSFYDLFKMAERKNKSAEVTFGLQNGSKKAKGSLCFSYRFGEAISDEPPLWKKTLKTIGMTVVSAVVSSAIGVVVRSDIPKISQG